MNHFTNDVNDCCDSNITKSVWPTFEFWPSFWLVKILFQNSESTWKNTLSYVLNRTVLNRYHTVLDLKHSCTFNLTSIIFIQSTMWLTGHETSNEKMSLIHSLWIIGSASSEPDCMSIQSTRSYQPFGSLTLLFSLKIMILVHDHSMV